jgi:hypothetical protein
VLTKTLTFRQTCSSTNSSAASRSHMMHCSWRKQQSSAAALTCAAPTWLARAALLRDRDPAASGAPSAE